MTNPAEQPASSEAVTPPNLPVLLQKFAQASAYGSLDERLSSAGKVEAAFSNLQARIAALEADLTTCRESVLATAKLANDKQREVVALNAERDALRKDAERYRWLRDVSVPPHNFYLSVPIEFDGVKYSPSEVDDAIDAALSKKGPQA
jgi:hypothetical protein